MPVELVEPPPTALQSLRNFLGPLLGPFGGAVMTLVFAVVMLIGREDLRNRALRRVGVSQLTLATEAFADATGRVSRYLRMQFLVNTIFGTVIAGSLSLVGLQGAVRWGALAGLLRFVPYIGPVIAGALPFAVSFSMSEGWTQPLLTLGVFLLGELTVAYVIEPWLYGKNTGISSLVF